MSTTLAVKVIQVMVLVQPYKQRKFSDLELVGPFDSFEAADEWIDKSIKDGWLHPRSRFRLQQTRSIPEKVAS